MIQFINKISREWIDETSKEIGNYTLDEVKAKEEACYEIYSNRCLVSN